MLHNIQCSQSPHISHAHPTQHAKNEGERQSCGESSGVRLNIATGEQQLSAHCINTPRIHTSKGKVLFCLLHACYHCCGGCPEDMQLNCVGMLPCFLSNGIHVPSLQYTMAIPFSLATALQRGMQTGPLLTTLS